MDEWGSQIDSDSISQEALKSLTEIEGEQLCSYLY